MDTTAALLKRRHHRHRGVLELGPSVAFVGFDEPRSMPLFEASDIDNEIIMEPINLPPSIEAQHTYVDTTDVSDDASANVENHLRSTKKTLRKSRKHHHHHHHHHEHRRQRKRKKGRIKELDELNALKKKLAREERKWLRQRKKELEFEEMFFDQESHNPNVIPASVEQITPPCTDPPPTPQLHQNDPKETELTSRIDHFRYHRVRDNSQGDGPAPLPFVAITDPRPRDAATRKSQISKT
ncbi:hypothetical protein DMENIID0001_141490 [Sergentomyia squamirostris]